MFFLRSVLGFVMLVMCLALTLPKNILQSNEFPSLKYF